MGKRRPSRDDQLTRDLARMWLAEPAPLPEYRPEAHDTAPLAHLDAPALLDLLGREGLDWHRQMRRGMEYGMLAAD